MYVLYVDVRLEHVRSNACFVGGQKEYHGQGCMKGLRNERNCLTQNVLTAIAYLAIRFSSDVGSCVVVCPRTRRSYEVPLTGIE